MLALAACTASAQGEPPVLPQARVVGEGRLDWLGLRIYDARLLALPAFAGSDYARHPFVLELTYRRALRGRDIARRSIEEMRRLPAFDESQAQRWERALAALLPDVQPGDRIAGVHQPGSGAQFLLNGHAIGAIAEPPFATLFFGIWLAPGTSEPALREALLGGPR